MRRDGGFEMEVGMTLAEQLAGRICSLSFEALPADVVEHAGSEASGTLEYDRAGGDVKRLFPAMAARSGGRGGPGAAVRSRRSRRSDGRRALMSLYLLIYNL
jgi:hypothetical protein